LGDINSDNKLDLVLAYGSSEGVSDVVSVLPGNGDGPSSRKCSSLQDLALAPLQWETSTVTGTLIWPPPTADPKRGDVGFMAIKKAGKKALKAKGGLKARGTSKTCHAS